MIWKFISQIQIGDKILLNRGKRTIFAIGEVESTPYLFETRDAIARRIKWISLPEEIPIPEGIKNKFSRYIISLTI